MRKRMLTFWLLTALLLSGCNLNLANSTSASPTKEAAAVQAWFDAPLPNSVFLLPGPCQIVAHGASPNRVAAFELTINGTAASIPSPDAQPSLVTLTRDCGLSEPGEYQLRLRAQDNAGNWSGFAETSLILFAGTTPSPASPTPEVIATETFTPTSTPEVIATETLTPTPTSTLTPTPSGRVSIERISSDLVYIGDTSCGPTKVTILARATAPKDIKVVVLFYRFATGNSSTEFQGVAMNPIGGNLYQRALDLNSLFGGSIPFDAATLQYQVVVQQTDGDTSLRTPVMADIAVQACGSPACSSYTSKESCEANGCKWVLVPTTAGRRYVCQNP